MAIDFIVVVGDSTNPAGFGQAVSGRLATGYTFAPVMTAFQVSYNANTGKNELFLAMLNPTAPPPMMPDAPRRTAASKPKRKRR